MSYQFSDAVIEYQTCKTGKILGRGTSGIVYECENDDKFVIKEVTNPIHLKNENDFIEYECSSKFKHVAKLYFTRRNPNVMIIEKVECILSDFLKNDVFDVLYSPNNPPNNPPYNPPNNLPNYLDNALILKKVLDTSEKIQHKEDIILKLLKSIKHLHSTVKYSHNDIKPENVGYNNNKDGEKQIKYIDLGSSEVIKSENEGKAGQKIMGYTMQYASHSILNGKVTNTKRDNWAIATLIYEIIADIPLFYSRRSPMLYGLILSVDTDVKLMYLLGMGTNDVSPFSPDTSQQFKNARELFCCSISKYNEKNIIVDFMYNAFKDDILNNEQDEPFTALGGGEGVTRFDQKLSNQTPSTQTPVTQLKHTPILDTDKIYSLDKQGRITIKDFELWKTLIKQTKKEIIEYEQSDQYPLDICTYNNNNKADGSSKHLYMKDGIMYERKVITENAYHKGKKNKNKSKQVSRFKLKNGKFVYYMKKPVLNPFL